MLLSDGRESKAEFLDGTRIGGSHALFDASKSDQSPTSADCNREEEKHLKRKEEAGEGC